MRVEELPATVYAYGFSGRKLKILRRFAGDTLVSPVSTCAALDSDAVLMLWGSLPLPQGCPATVRVVRLEDGFLRSVGLGADLIAPVSWVMDQTGIYYDATRPSDLEQILQTTLFDTQLLDRAARMRECLVACGLTKYNVGRGGWQRSSESATGQRVILVPGQVESDASIRFGAPGVCRNLDLLQAVRQANSDAYIVYKPHPDVVAGLRRQGQGEDAAAIWCDEVLVNVSMGELLPMVDEVHTLTSLTGFEALLRGKKVICYGQPFYAGWGLTDDIIPPERRSRRLALDELVAGALLLYPVYVSRETGRFTTPEQALDELLTWRAGQGVGEVLWRRLFRVILRCVTGVR